MKIKSTVLALVMCFSSVALLAEDSPSVAGGTGEKTRASVSMDQLPELVMKSGPLTLNNFNLLSEEAFFGGYKVTAQVTGRNRSSEDINYTVYVIAKNFDEEKKTSVDVCCFKIEPELNIHEAGKIETLTDSGLLTESDFKRINKVVIKLVVQKSE